MAKEITPEQMQMIDEMVAKARKAAKVIETYDQATVDRLCQAVCAAVYPLKIWGNLSDEAVDETRLGDKVTKRNKLKLILRECLRHPSVGVIETIPEKGLVKYAKPVGVIGVLVPTTNPCLTPAGQAIYAIKARDVIICSPHPRAAKVTAKCVNLMREALEREGADPDIIQVITEPSISVSQYLMTKSDLVMATGGRPMVKSAYSSGVPAYGSGAGNATVIVDETAGLKPEYIKEAAMNTRISKCSDFGSGCSCDGNLVVHESVYDDFVKALVEEGAYLASADDAEKIKLVMWDETGHRLPDTVAISPQALAEKAGFSIPADRKFIAVTGGGMEGIGKEHFFSSEKLTTLLTLFKYEGEFENALDMMRAIFEVGGKGRYRRAFKVAGERRYRDFRKDNTLDIRQFQMAFRLLRQYSSHAQGEKTELDVDGTVRATGDKGGILDVRYRRPRKNTVKVLMLMDSGGSMEYYANLCSMLFQAAERDNRFKELHVYYFHNCLAPSVYTQPQMRREHSVATDWVLKNFGSDYKVIFVGDAMLDMYELLEKRFDWRTKEEKYSGMDYLKRFREQYPHLVWLNPEDAPVMGGLWGESYGKIAQVVDMYPLSVSGLERAMKKLLAVK